MSISFKKIIPRSRQSILTLLAVVVTLVAVVRICLSYTELSVTWDEPGHIAAGMQWLDHGKYTLESLHPPIGRAATAVFPYLDGSRAYGDTSLWTGGNNIFNGGDHYWRTVALSRLGIMPFFLLSIFILWSWSKKMFGVETAFLAVLFYTLVPPVLAHAGLATTDYPLTAAFLASCYGFWKWIQAPSKRNTILLGILLGLSAGTKFSFLVFFPPAAIVIAVYELFILQKTKVTPALIRSGLVDCVIALFFAFITLWGCYLFSFGPIVPSVAAAYETPHFLVGITMPMPQFFDGVAAIFNKNELGHAIYFMGKRQLNHGSIWFFPVTLAMKTPIAFMILAIVGAAMIFLKNRAWKTKEYLKSYELLPLLLSAVLLALVMPSDINLGVLHILPIYPFLAMLAALGALRLIAMPKPYSTVGLTLLIGWMAVSSFSPGNDRIAYFNELAGSHPERYFVGSDLDWGQDLWRLSDSLRAEHIEYVSMYYSGSADLSKSGLPQFERLWPYTAPKANWVAISLLPLYAFNGYEWLQAERPFEKIGNSIILYHFTDAELAKFKAKFANFDISSKENEAVQHPSPESFLDLSSAYYKAKRFTECITTARKSLLLKPDYAAAYNNISAGFLAMSEWDSAIVAANDAIRINPNNQLLKNNLTTAEQGKKSEQENILNLENTAKSHPTADNYLNLSAAYYNALQFENSISAARKAIAINPDYAAAYNNICAASNKLGNFDEGKKAGDRALQIEPNNLIFQINHNASTEGLAKK